MPLKQTTGSRAMVMHGTAKKTSGGLTKSQLKYNIQGKIVSRKASELAKKNNRLVKAGYVTTKGKFGIEMRGGAIKCCMCGEKGLIGHISKRSRNCERNNGTIITCDAHRLLHSQNDTWNMTMYNDTIGTGYITYKATTPPPLRDIIVKAFRNQDLNARIITTLNTHQELSNQPVFIAGNIKKKKGIITIRLNIFNSNGVRALAHEALKFKKPPDKVVSSWIYSAPDNSTLQTQFDEINCAEITDQIKATPCGSHSKGAYTIFYSKARDLGDYILKLQDHDLDDSKKIWDLLETNILDRGRYILFNNTTYPVLHAKSSELKHYFWHTAAIVNPLTL